MICNNVAISVDLLRITNIYSPLPSCEYVLFLNIFICKARITAVSYPSGSSHMPNFRVVTGRRLTSSHKCKRVLFQCDGLKKNQHSMVFSTEDCNGQILCSLSLFARQRLQRTHLIFIFLIRELQPKPVWLGG